VYDLTVFIETARNVGISRFVRFPERNHHLRPLAGDVLLLPRILAEVVESLAVDQAIRFGQDGRLPPGLGILTDGAVAGLGNLISAARRVGWQVEKERPVAGGFEELQGSSEKDVGTMALGLDRFFVIEQGR